MYNQKTRCSECVYADDDATKDPCSSCNELMPKAQFRTNHFKDKSKYLILKHAGVQNGPK